MTTLRSAICYISELQQLLTDYDAGMLDPAKYQDQNHQPTANGQHQTTTAVNNNGRRRPPGGRKRPLTTGAAGGGGGKVKLSRRPATAATGERRRVKLPGGANRVTKQRRVVLRPKWTDYSGSLTLASTDCGQHQLGDATTSFSSSPSSSNSSSISTFSSSSSSSFSPTSSPSPSSSYLVSTVPYLPAALPPAPSGGHCLLPPASPRDVNVISLYISLIDSTRD